LGRIAAEIRDRSGSFVEIEKRKYRIVRRLINCSHERNCLLYNPAFDRAILREDNLAAQSEPGPILPTGTQFDIGVLNDLLIDLLVVLK